MAKAEAVQTCDEDSIVSYGKEFIAGLKCIEKIQ